MSGLNYLNKSKKELIKKFQQFYYKKAAPVISKYEKRRIPENKSLQQISISICSFVVIWIIALLNSLTAAILLMFLGLSAFAIWTSIKKKTLKLRDYDFMIKDKLMPEFLSLFGKFNWCQYEMFAGYWETIQRFTKLKISPKARFFFLDDVIEGEYNGINLCISEIRGGVKKINIAIVSTIIAIFIAIGAITLIGPIAVMYVIKVIAKTLPPPEFYPTIYGPVLFYILLAFIPFILIYCFLMRSKNQRAIIVEFDIPKHFKGMTCVYEKSPNADKVIHQKIEFMEQVHLEDVKFDALHKVYSTDQIEARYLLTTAFIDRFLMIKTTFKAKYIRAEFSDGKLTLVIGTDKDLFSMGDISNKIAFNTFFILFEELYSVLALVDTLKLNQKTGL